LSAKEPEDKKEANVHMEKVEYGREGVIYLDAPYVKADVMERYLARIIDFIIAGAIYGLLRGIGPIAAVTYILIADALLQGQSLGKRIVGMRVLSLDRDDAPCDFKESVLRNAIFALVLIAYFIVGWIPYLGTLVVVLSAIAILFTEAAIVFNDRKGIRFGDRIARTMVVKS
jgi:uncharacterized RDD family membrane protein YckC